MSWIPVTSAASVLVATGAFLFQVWNTTTSRKRESSRRDWERLQALSQVLYDGQKNGLWAQKLAIEELAQLQTRRDQVLLLCREALDYWDQQPPSDPGLRTELQTLIAKLRG